VYARVQNCVRPYITACVRICTHECEFVYIKFTKCFLVYISVYRCKTLLFTLLFLLIKRMLLNRTLFLGEYIFRVYTRIPKVFVHLHVLQISTTFVLISNKITIEGWCFFPEHNFINLKKILAVWGRDVWMIQRERLLEANLYKEGTVRVNRNRSIRCL
jgi:hypothetical protein